MAGRSSTAPCAPAQAIATIMGSAMTARATATADFLATTAPRPAQGLAQSARATESAATRPATAPLVGQDSTVLHAPASSTAPTTVIVTMAPAFATLDTGARIAPLQRHLFPASAP